MSAGPTIGFSVPDSVLSTTLANYRPTLEDNIFKANPLFYWLAGRYQREAGLPEALQGARGQKKMLSGGSSIVIPLMYETNSTADSYSAYGLLDTTPQEGITAAEYNWKQYSATVSISGKEEAQNSGPQQIINLLEGKIKQAEMSLAEVMNQHAFSTGTDSTTNLLGLQTIVATTGTVGNISRTGNSWWQSSVRTSEGSFAANGLNAMRIMYNNVSKGSIHPDFIITDQSDFERYEAALQPQERFTDSRVADGGFQNLKFKGAVMFFDAYAPSGYMYFLNSQYLNLVVHSRRDFVTTEFVKPENQDARIAQILWMGELTCSNAARQGVIQGLTA